MAMYKTRNTGTGNGMQGTRGIGGMWPNIPGNVLKHSGECRQTFRGRSSNIPGTFRAISQNIPGNVAKHSEDIPGMSPNIPGNVAKHSAEFPRKIQRIFENNMWDAVKNYVKSMKGFG